MITIGICDDEYVCRQLLFEYCQNIGKDLNENFRYQMFGSGEEVLAYHEDIDILLLDVEMTGENGIEVMKKIEKSFNIKNILFVSGYSQHVYDSFSLKTRGFICKPVVYERFKYEIEKIIEMCQVDRDIYELVLSSGTIYVSSDEIVLIEVQGKYLKIYTKEKYFDIRGSLSEWEIKLRKHNVIQVHKSYLVNLNYVKNIKDVVTFICVDIEVPLGRKYRDTSRIAYKEYILKNFRERTNGN